MSAGLGARAARAARGAGGRPRRCSRRCSSRCSSSSSTSARPAKIFPSASTEFLEGQGYGAFQLPSSLLLAASFGTAALFLVEDIEGGYFDKLRAAPISRTAIVLGPADRRGRQGPADRDRDRRCSALPFGITIASGPLGFVLLVVLTALWAVVFAGFMQLIALKTRSAAATNSGGPDLLPAAVPDAELRAARPAHPADGDRGDAQPGHLRHGGAALADPRGPRLGARSCPASRSSPSLGALMLVAQRPHDPTLRLTQAANLPCEPGVIPADKHPGSKEKSTMVSITIKRAFATVAVVAGVLAVAGPAGASTRCASTNYCATGITDGTST